MDSLFHAMDLEIIEMSISGVQKWHPRHGSQRHGAARRTRFSKSEFIQNFQPIIFAEYSGFQASVSI